MICKISTVFEMATDEIKAKYDVVDVLCNNAGVMALEDRATKDGYDVQMQTNSYLAFFTDKGDVSVVEEK